MAVVRLVSLDPRPKLKRSRRYYMARNSVKYYANSTFPSQRANAVHVVRMCEALVRNGYEVTLVCYRVKPCTEEEVFSHYGVVFKFAIEFVDVPSERLKFVWGFGSLLSSMSGLDKECIVYGRDIYPLFLLALIGFSVCFEAHSAPINCIEAGVIKILVRLRNFRKIVVISTKLKEYFVESIRIHREHIVVAHDACDPFDNLEEVSTNTPLSGVGYVGSLDRTGRGINVILAAASAFPKQTFHVVGGSESEVAFWRARASKNVEFYGYQPSSLIPLFMRKFDVALMPYEPNLTLANSSFSTLDWMSPMKMFEYMAGRKVIISSDFEVLREVLNADNSYLIDPNDQDAWINCLATVLESYQIARTKAEKGHNEFLQRHTWDARILHLKSFECF